MNTITDAFDDFSHSLRVLQEADFRAASGLLVVDRAEAVGNIENAWSSVLNAFHSLYDAMEKDPGYSLDWYAKPELALILVLRNARHHNHARKVRTLYAHYVQEAEKIGRLEMYLLLDFPAARKAEIPLTCTCLGKISTSYWRYRRAQREFVQSLRRPFENIWAQRASIAMQFAMILLKIVWFSMLFL